MRKTILMKTISLLLALSLAFCMAVNASAASFTWTQNGTTYYANVGTPSSTQRSVTIPGTGKYHTNGTATLLVSGGTVTLYAYYSGPTDSTYKSKIEMLAEDMGLNTGTISWTGIFGMSRTVPASQASGNVALTVQANYQYASWSVRTENATITSYANLGNGTLYAPVSFPANLGSTMDWDYV